MKVLIVDDCADSTFLLSRLVEACGHETRSAKNAKTAMIVVAEWRADAIFVDIGLPAESGYALARRLRTEAGLESALIVALSGYVDDEVRRIESGINFHLLKPASMNCLCDLLESWESREPAPVQ